MSAEYVTDVPYVRHFIADLSPTRLRLAAALNGVAPPPAEDFDYCELGCSHGDTLAALAASNPRARFLGIDINGEHVAAAKKLAREGGLENIGFLERDFSDILHEDLGEFDFVVAHGVLSWVSPEKRKALIDFAQAKLKPGGLLFVSYNAMPGWASVEPLRQLLLSPLGGADGTSLDRARQGIEFARAMQAGGAEYFEKNPSAAEMLGMMTKAGLPYVVHEYLHEHWAPMYFARVAWEMASSDLHFAGVLPVHLNFRDTAVPKSLEPVFPPLTDRITFESLKDFAINEFFRRDIYVKGTVARTTRATNEYLDSTAWGTLVNAAPERSVALPHRTLKLDGPVFDALFSAIAEGATPLEIMCTRGELADMGSETVRAGLVRLIVAGCIVPIQVPTRYVVQDPDAAFCVPSIYNQMMLRRLSTDTPALMTSVIAGTAFAISRFDALALRVFTEVPPAARDEWIRDFVEHKVQRLALGDRVFDAAEQRTVIRDAVETLRTNGLSKLVELGVLAPSPT